MKKYYTHIIEVNNKRYLICCQIGLKGFDINDIKEIKEFAYYLVEDVNTDVIFDYYHRNGHLYSCNNRLFVTDPLNHMHDIIGCDAFKGNSLKERYNIFKEILHKCNIWWSNNLDLLNEWEQKYFE